MFRKDFHCDLGTTINSFSSGFHSAANYRLMIGELGPKLSIASQRKFGPICSCGWKCDQILGICRLLTTQGHFVDRQTCRLASVELPLTWACEREHRHVDYTCQDEKCRLLILVTNVPIVECVHCSSLPILATAVAYGQFLV